MPHRTDGPMPIRQLLMGCGVGNVACAVPFVSWNGTGCIDKIVYNFGWLSTNAADRHGGLSLRKNLFNFKRFG